MGVYVKFPDGSMHWDESKADPNDNGGSVLDAATGKVIPGANRQSGPTGPGGNGPRGSQANPNGDYHAGPPVGGGVFGSGGFTGGQSGVAPLGQPNDFSATPFADWLLKIQRAMTVAPGANTIANPAQAQYLNDPHAAPTPGMGQTGDPYAGWSPSYQPGVARPAGSPFGNVWDR